MFHFANLIPDIIPVGMSGRVTRHSGMTISVADFPAPMGAQCRILRGSRQIAEAEVIGFHDRETLLLALGEINGLRSGDVVSLRASAAHVRVGEQVLGRVFDARGRVIDDGATPALPHRRPLYGTPPAALTRRRISQPLATGIRAIDALLTCGKGQRVGLFSGSGVGKSTLLGEIARQSTADVNVVVLVGERGREVREFVEKNLGESGRSRSVVIAATGDEAPTARLRAIYFGLSVAEFFRDQGRDVLLLVDSLTRVAQAQREIGLAAGEVPVARGFSPSVLRLLPTLLERSGCGEVGSITGIFSVLVDGDDFNEPIADAARGLLDGHWVMSPRLAEQAHWPAIDVLASVSRVMPDICCATQITAAEQLKRVLAAYRHYEDLIAVGAYQSGSNPLVDVALREQPVVTAFLQQALGQTAKFSDSIDLLSKLANRLQKSADITTAARTPESQVR